MLASDLTLPYRSCGGRCYCYVQSGPAQGLVAVQFFQVRRLSVAESEFYGRREGGEFRSAPLDTASVYVDRLTISGPMKAEGADSAVGSVGNAISPMTIINPSLCALWAKRVRERGKWPLV